MSQPEQVVRAPWSEPQVRALRKWQQRRDVHPYTCGTDSRHRPLVPTWTGWECVDCEYVQDWAWGYMLAERSVWAQLRQRAGWWVSPAGWTNLGLLVVGLMAMPAGAEWRRMVACACIFVAGMLVPGGEKHEH